MESNSRAPALEIEWKRKRNDPSEEVRVRLVLEIVMECVVVNLLLLLLKSVKVDDDVALLLIYAVLGSMRTQVTLQSKLGGTCSAAVRTR